jgi:hypothetical protein
VTATRALLGVGAAAAMLAVLVFPAVASAQVAVKIPGSRPSCAAGLRLGARYDPTTGPSSRRVTITVTSGSRTIYHRELVATAKWTYVTLHPACGRTYTVKYATATGIFQGPVTLLA